MLKRVFVGLMLLFTFVNAVCYANALDRWEWINSNDYTGYFFDKETIRFGTKEVWDAKVRDFRKKVDESKIIVYIKTVYTDAAKEDMIEAATNQGLFDQIDIIQNTEYRIEKFEIDYINKSCRSTAEHYYDANGSVIYSFQDDFSKWSSIIPNSNGEHWAKVVRSYALKNYDMVARHTMRLD